MYKGLVQIYINFFHEKGNDALKAICNCDVPSFVMLQEYSKLEPLESRPIKEKQEMWEYVKELFPDKDKETLIKNSRIIYTVGTLI